MARPDGAGQPALEAAGDGLGREPEPAPTNDIELDPVEAANLAEDSARLAVDGLPHQPARRAPEAAGTAQNGWSP